MVHHGGGILHLYLYPEDQSLYLKRPSHLITVYYDFSLYFGEYENPEFWWLSMEILELRKLQNAETSDVRCNTDSSRLVPVGNIKVSTRLIIEMAGEYE